MFSQQYPSFFLLIFYSFFPLLFSLLSFSNPSTHHQFIPRPSSLFHSFSINTHPFHSHITVFYFYSLLTLSATFYINQSFSYFHKYISILKHQIIISISIQYIHNHGSTKHILRMLSIHSFRAGTSLSCPKGTRKEGVHQPCDQGCDADHLALPTFTQSLFHPRDIRGGLDSHRRRRCAHNTLYHCDLPALPQKGPGRPRTHVLHMSQL